METDVGSWGNTYEGVKRGAPKLLKLMARHNIMATFLFTGEAALSNPEVVKKIKSDGHEIGCHTLQHETIGEEIFPLPFLSPVPESLVKERLMLATEVVEKVSGVRPVSFRAPRLFGSTAMVNALEELGYLIDASYPTYFFKRHLLPYHPSCKDWTKKGNMKILELPNFADMTLKSKDPWGRDRAQWPKFRTKGAKTFLASIKRVITLMHSKRNLAVLCFYFHPWEFVPMPSKLKTPEATVYLSEVTYKNCGDYALSEFEKLTLALQSQGATFMSMKDFAIYHSNSNGK